MFGVPGSFINADSWCPNQGVHLSASSPLNRPKEFLERSVHLRGITAPFANMSLSSLFVYLTVVLLDGVLFQG